MELVCLCLTCCTQVGEPSGLWGLRFVAIPEFARADLAAVARRHTQTIEQLHVELSKWTVELDAALVTLVNAQCNKSGANPCEVCVRACMCLRRVCAAGSVTRPLVCALDIPRGRDDVP